MKELEIRKYQSLNKVANCGGIVMFGSKDLFDLPLCELKQAFDINDDLYNRSFESLSLNDAQDVYAQCVSDIKPDTLFIQLGADDVEMFSNDKEKFIYLYRSLIFSIKRKNRKCRVAIVSLKNYDDDKVISEINKQLKYIADSENCDYCDVSHKKPCNLQQIKNISSFIYNMGFVQPLNQKRQINDLSRMLFCFE